MTLVKSVLLVAALFVVVALGIFIAAFLQYVSVQLALLLLIALLGLYLGRSGISSGFGAAGSLAALLVWLHYSAQIFLLGAEFTWVYANACGSRRAPSPAQADGDPA